MIVRVQVGPGVWVEEEADKEVDAFKAIARIQEVFTHTKCGKCESTDVRYVCRQDKDENDWLEMVCQKCRAKLIYGQKKGKGGEIYPKIRWSQLSETQQKERASEQQYAEEHRGFLPNNGWYHFKRSGS